MKKEIIKKGTEIRTAGGYLVIDGYNGHIVYADEYEVDVDGSERKVRECMLTLSEIGALMKEVDGQGHKVIYEMKDDDEQD